MIDKLLKYLGIRKSLTGYWIIKDIIARILIDERNLSKIGELYLKIAQDMGTSYAAVEKNVRTAIQGCWSRKKEELCKIAKCDLAKCPSNTMFFEIVTAYIMWYEQKRKAHNDLATSHTNSVEQKSRC
ncbi:MAG: sporulation initiation factor Spo0A C-terminal domain-containing protein [Acutalibacteraceae bacterium]